LTITTPIEIAARAAIANRIGTKGEEEPPEVVVVGDADWISPGFVGARLLALEVLPGLLWLVPPLPLLGDEPDLEDPLPGPPEPPFPDGAAELWAPELLSLGIVVASGS
jgi:hypothetical protein